MESFNLMTEGFWDVGVAADALVGDVVEAKKKYEQYT